MFSRSISSTFHFSTIFVKIGIQYSRTSEARRGKEKQNGKRIETKVRKVLSVGASLESSLAKLGDPEKRKRNAGMHVRARVHGVAEFLKLHKEENGAPIGTKTFVSWDEKWIDRANCEQNSRGRRVDGTFVRHGVTKRRKPDRPALNFTTFTLILYSPDGFRTDRYEFVTATAW